MGSSSLSSSDQIMIRDWVEYIPLHRATLRGDWDTTHEFITKDKDALTFLIDVSDTTLHVAIELRDNFKFLDNLLKVINPESLPSILNEWKQNPLHRAAVVGNTEAAKMLVGKNPYLLFILDNLEDLPIHKAVYNNHQTTYLYLVDACKQYIMLSHQDGYHSPFEGLRGAKLLTNVISTGYLDVAYELINDYPHMAVLKNGTYAPLEAIANKRDAYLSGRRYNFYERFVYSRLYLHSLNVPTTNNELWNKQKAPDIENQHTSNATKCKNSFISSVSHIKHLQEDKRKHRKALMVLKCILEEVGKLKKGSDVFGHYARAFNQAVINDTPEAVAEIMEYFPRAAWTTYDNYHLSQLAVIYRCENVYNFLVQKMSLIHNEHLHKIFIDKEGNNLLHLAGKLAPIEKLNLVSGAALQMQRELQWFQAVEKYMRPSDKEAKNKKHETPFMMFRREHAYLRKEGEEWMKKTSDSYTITAALIITIVFAAAITVPGGTNGDNGKAIYASNPSFIIFAISDAISLFTSTTSLLLFLSILTARYRDEDFLYKLPKRLIFGLAMLFLSVTSLMVAFSATLYLMLGDGRAWILIPIASLACLPIASFVTLQLPLLFDLISSTYGQGIFDKTTKNKKTCKIEWHHQRQ